MKAIVFNKNGIPEKLVLQEVEKPNPLENEVLVKIRAVSVNAADYRSMQLGMIPKNGIFGSDVAGVVEAVGSQVKSLCVGDEVLGDLSGKGSGGFAEFVTAPESTFVIKPVTVSFEVAAAVPMAAMTALQAIRDKGQVQAGQKVLIYGSGGGVGTFAVQLAKYYVAEVTAVCNTKNVPLTRSLGADHVVDYSEEDILNLDRKFDVIIVVNGNRRLMLYKKVLSAEGRVVMVGGSLSQILKTMIFGPILSMGSKKISLLAAKALTTDLEFIIKLVAEGKIKPVIDRTYPLKETSDAINYLKQGHAQGKVVISVLQSKPFLFT
ncbi:MAG: alcohol dehydrogenase [Chloroflexi bacterium HGW-Chloroflexi-3]|nr:MAG: alcohol dehydrogenase [Chloroflexi bacterium HGW-Chloroflexi-3]